MSHSDGRFYAKVSRVKRKDSICFWVSRHAFFVLENYFSECKEVIGGTMPFIAYRGEPAECDGIKYLNVEDYLKSL